MSPDADRFTSDLTKEHYVILSRWSAALCNGFTHSVVALLMIHVSLVCVSLVKLDEIRTTPAHVFWTIQENIALALLVPAVLVVGIPWVTLPLLLSLSRGHEKRSIRRRRDWTVKWTMLLVFTSATTAVWLFAAPFIITTIRLAGLIDAGLWLSVATALLGPVIQLIQRVVIALSRRPDSAHLAIVDFPELMKPHSATAANLDVGALASRIKIVQRGLEMWEEYSDKHGTTSELVWDGVTRGPDGPGLSAIWAKEQKGSGWRGVAGLRQELAELVNASRQQVIFTTNTTRAIRAALESLLPETLVMGDLDHPSQQRLVSRLQRRTGMKVVHLPIKMVLENGGRGFNIAEHIGDVCQNERADTLLLTHVLYGNGAILPVEDIMGVIKRVAPGCRVVIDGAHAVGLIPVDVSSYGCVFYAFGGHKWLYGPATLGVLIAAGNPADDVMIRLEDGIDESLALAKPDIDDSGSSIALEPLVGLANSLAGLKEVGWDNVRRNVQNLKALFEATISETKFVRIVGVETLESVGGILNVQRRDRPLSLGELRKARSALERRHRVVTRVVDYPPSLRVCVPYYLSRRDVQRSVAALEAVFGPRGDE